MNAKKHSVATGAPANIEDKTGTKFTTHGGYISGENLQLVKNKTIVQTWRTMEWDKKDPDSILIIHLDTEGEDTILHATHANVPDKHAASITKAGMHITGNPGKNTWREADRKSPLCKRSVHINTQYDGKVF